MSSSPHYKGVITSVTETKGRFVLKSQALDIVWGGDTRYWRHSKETASVELLQVSWLEVRGSLELSKLTKDGEYTVSFKLSMKQDAYGWSGNPVHLMVKPGKKASPIWKSADLSTQTPDDPFYVPSNQAIKFKVPTDVTQGDVLLFGMYEIWRGRWKGGLVIHEVIVEPVTTDTPTASISLG